MKLKFVKLIRVSITVEMPDGSTRYGYRYMDIDGNILAESLKGEVYPSAIREMKLEAELEAKQTQDIRSAYGAIQRDIVYNHIAIVAKGRAGVARLNMDDEPYGIIPARAGHTQKVI